MRKAVACTFKTPLTLNWPQHRSFCHIFQLFGSNFKVNVISNGPFGLYNNNNNRIEWLIWQWHEYTINPDWNNFRLWHGSHCYLCCILFVIIICLLFDDYLDVNTHTQTRTHKSIGDNSSRSTTTMTTSWTINRRVAKWLNAENTHAHTLTTLRFCRSIMNVL